MSRPTLALAVLAILVGAVAARFAWQPGLASLYDDSVSYLVMAQAMDPWTRPVPPVMAAFPAQTYPPAFPLLVALAGGAHDWRIAHEVVVLCFALTVFLSGRFAIAVTGSAVAGFATALTVAALPEAWINLKGILSEFPYMAASLAALAWHRGLDGIERPRPWILLGALVALALLTRTVGVALVAGIGAAEALRWWRTRNARRARLAALALAIPLAAAALWYLLRPTPPHDVYARILSGVARDVARQGPVAWVATTALEDVAGLMFSWLHALMLFWSPGQPRVLLGAALGVLAIAGVAARALRGEADALYAAAFLGILMVYPFPGHMYRLGLPIVPVLLVAAWWLLLALVEHARPGAAGMRAARLAAWGALAPLALCVPALLFYVAARAHGPERVSGPYRSSDIAEFYRISMGPAAATVASRQIDTFLDLDRIGATTPPGARVMWYLPDYIALLSGRYGVEVPGTRDPAAFAAALRGSRADFLYVSAIGLRDEGTGGDNPLAPAGLAAPYADVVWSRRSAKGELEAALLRIDPQKLEGPARP